jgi:hypothetical protein
MIESEEMTKRIVADGGDPIARGGPLPRYPPHPYPRPAPPGGATTGISDQHKINTREVTMCVIDGSTLIFEFEILPLLA